MRLDRILANSGIGSRSEVKEYIRKGRISLNGKVLRSAKTQIKDEEKKLLRFDNKEIEVSKFLYYALNKPADFVTSMEVKDPQALVHILPEFFLDKKIMPVGRLDKDTTGLLIFTNNGELNHRLLSPKYKIPRKYYTKVEILDHGFEERDVTALKNGLQLNSRENALPADLEIISEDEAFLTLYEGKFHEVKRLIKLLGKEVQVLHRLQYGTLVLDDEKSFPGDLRKLGVSEVTELIDSVGMDADNI